MYTCIILNGYAPITPPLLPTCLSPPVIHRTAETPAHRYTRNGMSLRLEQRHLSVLRVRQEEACSRPRLPGQVLLRLRALLIT